MGLNLSVIFLLILTCDSTLFYGSGKLDIHYSVCYNILRSLFQDQMLMPISTWFVIRLRILYQRPWYIVKSERLRDHCLTTFTFKLGRRRYDFIFGFFATLDAISTLFLMMFFSWYGQG